MNDEHKDYVERHIRWHNTTIQHLGFTNNLIITLSIGLIAVLINKDLLSTISFSLGSYFSWNLTLHLLTLLSLLLSTLSGIINTMSRLYDFRITRNISLTRQRVYVEDGKRKKMSDFSFDKTTSIKALLVLCSVLSSNDIGLLERNDAKILAEDIDKNKVNELKYKFNKLRGMSSALGELTWKTIKWQVLFLLAAIILFSISLFTL